MVSCLRRDGTETAQSALHSELIHHRAHSPRLFIVIPESSVLPVLGTVPLSPELSCLLTFPYTHSASLPQREIYIHILQTDHA